MLLSLRLPFLTPPPERHAASSIHRLIPPKLLLPSRQNEKEHMRTRRFRRTEQVVTPKRDGHIEHRLQANRHPPCSIPVKRVRWIAGVVTSSSAFTCVDFVSLLYRGIYGQHRWHVHSPELLSRACRAKTESGEDMTPTMFTARHLMRRRASELALLARLLCLKAGVVSCG